MLHSLPKRTSSDYAAWRRRLILLLVLLVVAIMVAVHAAQPPSVTEQLHGDDDQASGGVQAALARAPETNRDALLAGFANDPAPNLRAAAMDAIGERPMPQEAALLEHAFQDSSAQVRTRALETLPKIDRERGIVLLLRGMTDEDRWIRETAVEQLRVYGDKREVPEAIAALNDDDPTVPHLAQGLLTKWTGKHFVYRFGDSPAHQNAVKARWQAWWAAAKATWPTAPSFATLAAVRPTRADPAPNFDARDTEGRAVRLADQRGRVTLLNFWGTWCPPCQTEIPDLARLDREYRSQGLDVIGIALAETSDKSLSDWCAAHHVAYRQVQATPGITDPYGHIQEVPVSVLIDKHGQIRYRWDGERDYTTFQAAVKRLLTEA